MKVVDYENVSHIKARRRPSATLRPPPPVVAAKVRASMRRSHPVPALRGQNVPAPIWASLLYGGPRSYSVEASLKGPKDKLQCKAEPSVQKSKVHKTTHHRTPGIRLVAWQPFPPLSSAAPWLPAHSTARRHPATAFLHFSIAPCPTHPSRSRPSCTSTSAECWIGCKRRRPRTSVTRRTLCGPSVGPLMVPACTSNVLLALPRSTALLLPSLRLEEFSQRKW